MVRFMKSSSCSSLFSAVVIFLWTALPWLFWIVHQHHAFGHADPFWLLAIPFVLMSMAPMLIAAPEAIGFPLRWVIESSIFNLILGFLIWLAIYAWRVRRSNRQER
jgi:hypothetical protein